MSIAGALSRLGTMPDAAHGAAVPFSFANKRAYKDHFSDKQINRAINAPAPIKTVTLSELHAIQHSVVPARVRSYITNPAMIPSGARSSKHHGLIDYPIVIEYAGTKYIHDGHHRLTALWLRGKTTAKVRYVTLNGADA